MKKKLSIMMLLAALIVPWASRAQSDCTPISTFPVTYGFEASEGFTTTVTAAAACTTNVFNACWRNEETSFNSTSTTTQGRIWHIYGGTSATYVHSGSGSLMLPDKGSSSAGVSTTMLVFPAMDFTNPSGYVVSFWIQRNGTGTSTPEGFKVYASTTDTIGPDAVLLGHYSRHRTMAYPVIESTTGWYQYETDPITLTGTVYIIFEGQSYYSSSTYVDDVVIMETPTCLRVTNLAVDASETTTGSLTLTWDDTLNTGAAYNVYMLGASDTTLVESGVYGNSYTVQGLNSGTSYTFAVVTDCGGNDTSMFSRTVTAYTACADITAADLPYTETFEDYTASSTAPISPCWTKGTNSSTAYPYVSTTAVSGSKSLYFYSNRASTATGTSYHSWVALPPIDENLQMNTLQVDFLARRYSTTTAAYHSMIAVGIAESLSQLGANMDSVTWVDTIDLTSLPASTITENEVTFDNYTGTGRYVVFYAFYPNFVSGTTQYNYIYLDDITLRAIPTCYRPAELVAHGLTSGSATLTWTPDSRTPSPSWVLEYGESGFVPGSGTTINPTDTTATITGLDPNTEYDAYVYASCGSDMSDPRMVTFRTHCTAISSLPYSNDFESEPYYLSGTTTYAEAFPECWFRINDATGTNDYYPYINTSSTYLINGQRSMYWYHTTTAGYAENEYAVLPEIDLSVFSLSEITLSFYAKTTATASPWPLFIVGVMNTPEDASTFVPVDTITLTSTAELYSVSFANYSGTGSYIAIRCPRTTSVRYCSLDDIYLTNDFCDVPENVSATATTDEVTLSWNTNGGDSFTVVFGEDTINGVSDSSYTFSDLTPNTAYSYAVATECSSSSSIFIEGTVRTLCVALDSLPYTQTFEQEATNTSSTEWNVPCWHQLNNATQYYGYPYVSSTSTYNHTAGGTKGLYWYGSTTTGTYGDYYCIVLPVADADLYPVNTLQVRFWAKSSSTSYDVNFQVGVMTNPTDINSFQFVDNVHVGGNTTWTEYTVALGTYTGQGQYVAIKAVRTSSTWYAYMDDITLETMPNCPPITDLTATPTVGAALLNWGWQAGYDAPDNYIVTYDSVGGTNPITLNATTNSIALTGLEPNTDYKAYVKADCGSDGMGRMDSVTFSTGDFGCVQFDLTQHDSISIGSGTTTSYYIPIGNYYNYSYTQQLITANELNGATAITGIDFQYAATSSSTGKTNVTIYLANTSETSLANAFVPYNASTFVPVYTGNLNCHQGWNHFQFTTPFSYDGSSNLLIVVHDNSGDYDGTAYTFYGHSATGKARYVQNDSSPYSISTVNGGTSYSTRANMRLHTAGCTAQATCAEPAVVVTGVTANTVDLAWAPGADETSWNVDYRVHGTGAWISEATAVSTNEYSFSGLQDATEYEFRVWFECGDANSTVYAGTATATTLCLPKTLPYSENFDNISTSTTAADNYGVMPLCWDYIMTGTSSYTTGSYLPGVYYSAAYAASGSYCLRLAGVGVFELPEMGAQLDSLRISFSDTITSASYNGLVVGVVENGQFLPIDTVDLALGTRNYIEVMLSDYHGTSRTIALKNFYATSTSTYYSYQYIDDLVVDYIPQCSHVNNLTADSIGEDVVVLSWTPVGASATWLVVNGADSVVVADSSVTITGLSPNTPYTFEVYSLCGTGDTSEVASIDVRTACTAQPLPYTEGFESYSSGSAASISTCWVKGTNSTTAYPYPSTTAITGSRSLYFYAYHPSSTSSTPIWSYAALPIFQDTITNLMMTFKVRTYSSAQNYYTTNLVVGVMDNPHDISTFTGVDTFSFAGAAASSVHEVEVTFNNYTGTGKYIAIYDPVPPLFGANYDYSYAYVDDIVVDTIPNCMRPNHVTFTGITQNSATVHWMAGQNASSFDIEYGPSGFVQGTGTTVTSSVDSVDLTGLSASTQYDVYIRAHCSATDQSPWSFVQSFNTVCGPTALPMFFDPNNYTTGTTAALPHCWTRTNNSTGSYNYYPYIYSSSANAHSGSNTLYYYFSTSSGYSTDALMAFPEVDVVNYPMNQVEVSFWAKSSVANKPFMVGVMTNPAVASTFVAVDTITLTTTVSEYTVSLDNYTGNGTYIALRGVMSGTSSYYIYVDDIYIGVMSHCPRAYNLTAYNGTATGATLAWTDTIGSTQWVVEYHAYGDTVMHTVTANSNPFTLTGLTANTIYNYRVAPICSDGVQADWSRETFAFATSQVPATVPYSYDFENGTEWANWQTLSNNTVNWSRGNAVGHPGYSMYLSTDSGATRSYNMSAITNAAVYRDFDFGPTPASYELTFDALNGGSTMGNYDGITFMMVDPAVVPQVSSTYLGSPWGNISVVHARMDTVWAGESVYLDGVQGVKRIVFFHFNRANSSSQPYIDSPDAIDNIAIGVQPCARPYNLTADNITEHSAQLSWAGPATDTYIVAYRVYGAAAATNVYATVTGNSYVLNGLNSNTGYVYWVDHICSMTATDTLASDWSDGYRFATACGYTSLPYSEGFEGVTGHGYNAVGELPSCWGSYTDGTQAKYAPHVVDSGTYANYPHTGTKCLGMVSGSGTDFGTTKIAALPPFNAPISTLKMKFWYRMENASYGTLSVGYVTNLADLAGSFVQVHEVTSTTTVTQDSVSFDNAPANALQIAFRWYQNGTWYTVGIDDIEVWSTGPVCNNPTSLHATAVAYNSVSVAWSGTDSAEVGIHQGLWDETGATIATVTTSNYTFTGLTPNTQYTIAVRKLCEDNMTSDWVYLTVTTDDLPCFAPSNIQVSNETTNGGKVTWTPGGDETEWIVNVFRTGVVDTNITVINTPMCNVSGLYADMSYTISVASVCGGIDTVWCDTTATLTTTACLPPATVTAVANGRNAIVTWEGSGANEYHVLWFVEGFTTGADSVVVTNGTTNATIEDLEPGESYDIYVYAYCDGQRSAQAGQAHVTITGIDDVNSSLINLYPNPANTTVTVDGIKGEALVTIVDMNGRTVFSEKTVSSITIDLNGMAKGAYFVRITGENSSAIRKLIVK